VPRQRPNIQDPSPRILKCAFSDICPRKTPRPIRHLKFKIYSSILTTSIGEQMLPTPLPQLLSLYLACSVIASFKKSISRIQSVALSRHARKRPSFQNRAQKPFSDIPYLSRKQGFCAPPSFETLKFATILLGKNSTRRKNRPSPRVGYPPANLQHGSLLRRLIVRCLSACRLAPSNSFQPNPPNCRNDRLPAAIINHSPKILRKPLK
jgi:hypothetical protein